MGGTSRVNADLANYYAEQGHEVSILLLYSKPVDNFFQINPKVKIIYFFDEFPNTSGIFNKLKTIGVLILTILKLRLYFMKLSPDLIISFGDMANIMGIIANFQMKAKFLARIDLYPPMFPLNIFWDFLRKLTYPFAYRLVLANKDCRQWVNDNLPKAQSCIIDTPVAYPMVNSAPILPLELVNSRHIFIGVGRLVDIKGFDKLIKAFAQISPQLPDWQLVILGEGAERNNYQAQIDNLACADKIHLLGSCGNLGDWYQRADIFVLSSNTEAHGCVISEAMCYECAVIAFDCPVGPRNIINNNVNGILIENGNCEKLAQAMEYCAKNANIRENFTQNALKSREIYRVSVIAEQHLET